MRSICITLMILAGFFFSSSATFAQRKFAFSAIVAPFYGHTKTSTTVILPDYNGSGTLSPQEFKSESSPKGYWIGLNGRYSLSKKWSASTGLWFSQSRSKTSASLGRSHNFSIPVMVNFQTSERKLSPYFSAGALWNFGTTSRVDIPDMGTAIFKSDRNTSRVSPMVGAGVVYQFSPHLSLIAQPTFSYAIPPSGIHMRAYRLGFNAQLMFTL
ncbi:outer membrane beta-barrel protein [Dyadobacter sp. LHD-138]|uniref:outer membrane beta-barrel protein n=1 Tax=Dyadobacter sp. LHD-138 TaxID=3071413 RepID=UPI0027DF6643|nr:outer membrane beta-barrel protein [Dyadobacter sp. LHD-138]MDQ6477080.1 outer membrane beta-barrel protein [Dyadobacter sp. LHD-138]